MATRQPPAHEGLVRTSFSGIEFPAERHVLHGSARRYVHEYPHAPGGAPEKLGRGLYNITISANFQATFAGYPDLYPNGMTNLRRLFEQQVTATLVHPTVGSFDAFITDWRQVKDARMLSGEKVEIEFLEDQETQFLATGLVSESADATTVASSAELLDAELEAVRGQLALSPTEMSIFGAIQSTANSILAFRDTSALYGNLLSAKVEQLQRLCGRADGFGGMQDPIAWPVVNALHDLAAATQRFAKDVQSKQATLQTYVVPRTMPLAMIAASLYDGDASRQSDLLALNATIITNPLSVPAGTSLKYYPAS